MVCEKESKRMVCHSSSLVVILLSKDIRTKELSELYMLYLGFTFVTNLTTIKAMEVVDMDNS